MIETKKELRKKIAQLQNENNVLKVENSYLRESLNEYRETGLSAIEIKSTDMKNLIRKLERVRRIVEDYNKKALDI